MEISRKLSMDLLDLKVVVTEEGCRYEGQKRTGLHMWPVQLTAVKDRLLEFYSATCYDIGGDTSFDDGVGTIIKINVIP